MLPPTARSHNRLFHRALLWVKSYDRGVPGNDGTYAVGRPAEAVDPRTFNSVERPQPRRRKTSK